MGDAPRPTTSGGKGRACFAEDEACRSDRSPNETKASFFMAGDPALVVGITNRVLYLVR